MHKRWFFLLVLLALVLTACSSAASNPTSTLPVDPALFEAEATVAPTATEPSPIETAAANTEGVQPVQGFVSECTLVTSLPDTPDEYAQLFALKDGDWVVGPEDAAVTIIEYSDFQ